MSHRTGLELRLSPDLLCSHFPERGIFPPLLGGQTSLPCRDLLWQGVFTYGQAEAQDYPWRDLQAWAGEVFPVLGWIQFPAQVKSVFLEELLGFVLSVCLSVCQL